MADVKNQLHSGAENDVDINQLANMKMYFSPQPLESHDLAHPNYSFPK